MTLLYFVTHKPDAEYKSVNKEKLNLFYLV